MDTKSLSQMLTEAAGYATFKVEWVGEEEEGIMGQAEAGLCGFT